MRTLLALAGLWDLALGGFLIAFWQEPFRWFRLSEPLYPRIVQCVGLLLALWGVAFVLAAREPLRHWPVVLTGLLGKVLVPLAMLEAALRSDLPWSLALFSLAVEIVWWLPFALILAAARRAEQAPPVRLADVPKTPEPVVKLQQLLQTLSAPPNVQLRLFPDLGARLDEIAHQFRTQLDAALAAGHALLPQQRELLAHMSEQLAALTASEDQGLRTSDGVTRSDAWASLRRGARQALVTFGWSVDVPLSAIRRE
jgi:hypothetical protein